MQASLGDNLSGNSINRQLSQVQSNISDLDNNKMTFYDSTEIGKYQSDIIRGAKGGSIMMMNPSDLGKGESREPFQMVWMNGPSIEESDHFLVANSEGIGFIDGNFNLDNFKTAWTIDGIFNADFINAGTLQGVKIRSVDNDFIIELDQGKIRFIKKTVPLKMRCLLLRQLMQADNSKGLMQFKIMVILSPCHQRETTERF